MDRFGFRWLPPFTPGMFEVILFLLVLGLIGALRYFRVTQFALSPSQKVALLLTIFAAMGVVWTLSLTDSLAAPPWGIAAGYAVTMVLLLLVAVAARSYAVVAMCAVSLPLTLLGLSLFRSSTTRLVREGDLDLRLESFRFSQDRIRKEEAEDPRRSFGPSLRESLNGDQIKIQFVSGAPPVAFTNQGFAPPGEKANVNHLEVLEALVRKTAPRIRVEFELHYDFWALSSIAIVALDEQKFENFYYGPDAYRIRELLEQVPGLPRLHFSFGMPFSN